MPLATQVLMLLTFMICGMEFMNYCWAVAERLSQASIIVKRRNKEGQEILMDDYRESPNKTAVQS